MTTLARAKQLVRNFEAHHANGRIPMLSGFDYMRLTTAIIAYEADARAGLTDETALAALCDRLEGVQE